LLPEIGPVFQVGISIWHTVPVSTSQSGLQDSVVITVLKDTSRKVKLGLNSYVIVLFSH